MNPQKQKVLAGQLVELASKFKPLDDIPLHSRYAGVDVAGTHFGLVDVDADSLDAITIDLLQQAHWIEKYSETYVGNLVRAVLAALHMQRTVAKAESLLADLDAEYQAYDKKHAALVRLSGINMHEPELNIGRVKIKKVTRNELRLRLPMHAGMSLGEHIVNEVGDSVVAEHSAIAEPIRAKEIAVEETRRVMDLLRYAIPGILLRYKQLRMNVGITGEFAETEIFTVMLPCIEDSSVTFTTERRDFGLPFDVSKETIEKLHDCGAFAVSEILAKPAASLTDFERVLLRGIHWFGNALPQKEPENELLSLVTCLETFLTPREANPIGTAIAEGVALLLGNTLDERKRIKKRVKDLYSKRSTVSHGGEKAILDSDLAELRGITGKLIRSMIGLAGNIQSQKQLMEMIEDKKLA